MKLDVGVICAMQIEANLLIKKLEKRKLKRISNIKFYYGLISNKRVVVCVSGMGKVSATIAAQTMIMSFNPSVIVNTGVGGALVEGLKIGDIVVSEYFVQHDMDTSAIGDPKGFISGINIINLPSDEKTINEIVDSIKLLGYKPKVGPIATGDRFVCEINDKKKINNDFKCIACDMESGAIAQTCYMSDVKFCAIRSISDELNGKANDDYNKFTTMAANIGANITINFIQSI